jgi:hypothetical protein
MGADCFLFAGPFAARRLCGACIEDGALRMPETPAAYGSSIGLRHLALRRMTLAADLGGDRKFRWPRAWSQFPNFGRLLAMPTYTETADLNRHGFAVYDGVISAAEGFAIYDFARLQKVPGPLRRSSDMPDIPAAAQRNWIHQHSNALLSAHGGDDMLPLSKKVFAWLADRGFKWPSRYILLGMVILDAHPDAKGQGWHRDYPRSWADANLVEMLLNITPIRVFVEVLVGSQRDGGDPGPPVLVAVEPGAAFLYHHTLIHRGLRYAGNTGQLPPIIRLTCSHMHYGDCDRATKVAAAVDEAIRAGQAPGDEYLGGESESWGGDNVPDWADNQPDVDILGNVESEVLKTPLLRYSPMGPVAVPDGAPENSRNSRNSRNVETVLEPPLPLVDHIDGLRLDIVRNCFGRMVGVGVRATRAFAVGSLLGSLPTGREVRIDKRKCNHPWVWRLQPATRGPTAQSPEFAARYVVGREAGARDLLRFLDEGLSKANVVASPAQKDVWFEVSKPIAPGDWVLTSYVTGKGIVLSSVAG